MPLCHFHKSCYLPHRGADVSPFCAGVEAVPFCPCTVCAAVTTQLLAYRGESGAEPDIAIPISSVIIQIERKQARACGIIVIATAKGQT